MRVFRKVTWICALIALTKSVPAESIHLELEANTPSTFVLESPVDDLNFKDPCGYANLGAQHEFFNRRIVVENTGNTSLEDFALIVNNRDFRSSASLANFLNFNNTNAPLILYTFWKDCRFHREGGPNNPFELLNCFGFDLCGADKQSLSKLLHLYGVSSRSVPLNGHSAGEYFFDGQWHIIDGDQNAIYLNLDNRTFASFAEIKNDPFIGLRTKIFGKYGSFNITNSWYNTALFEHSRNASPRPIKPNKDWPTRLPAEDLQPKEKLIFYCYQAPPDRTTSRYDPIITELVSNNGVSAFGQRARIALPLFTRGTNKVVVAAKGTGKARITVDYQPFSTIELPVVTLKNKTLLFDTSPPEFDFELPPGAELLWWQIATEPEFKVVIPSFESIEPACASLRLDLLTHTFFSEAHEYWIRAKIRRHNIWGEWSQSSRFKVQKPKTPFLKMATLLSNGSAELRWRAPEQGVEYLVYGSNRIDFLPDIYSDEEICAMRNLAVEKTRPNKNLLVITSANSCVVPAFRFYRIISRRGSVLSTPTSLIKLGPESSLANLPPATVLQVRWRKIDMPNGYTDEYLACEQQVQNQQNPASFTTPLVLTAAISICIGALAFLRKRL
jgi:hypothetical protein